MVDIPIERPSDIIRNLSALRDNSPAELSEGLWQFAQDVMNDSAKMCPVDTGFLRGSRYVNRPVLYEDEIDLSLGYSAEYAVYVHELVNNWHQPPTQAKFLEIPLIQHAPGMLSEIVQRTMRIIAGGG